MLNSLRSLFAVSCLAFSLCPSTAHADPERDTANEAAPPTVPDALGFRLGVGAFGRLDKDDAGLNLAAAVVYRHGVLVLGGIGELGTSLWSYKYEGIGPTVGIALPLPSWARVELVAAPGIHHYSDVGSGLLSSDPGVSGTLPFLGVRSYLGVELGSPTFRFALGAQPFLETDLGRIQRTYSYTETFLAPHRETVTHTIGMSRAGVLLSLGITFNL